MMHGATLALEAATAMGSVAIIEEGRIIAERTVHMRGQVGERLLPAIIECLDEAALEREELKRIVCGSGPGSFTSLRIAGSLAKGLAMALTIPLYAVPSHLLIIAGAQEPPETGRYLVLIDALRGEFFAATIDVGKRGEITMGEPPSLLAGSEVASHASAQNAVLVSSDGHLGNAPHARAVARLSPLLERAGAVDLDRWEPDYGRPAEAQARWESLHGRSLG